MKLNYIVDRVTEYRDNKGQVDVHLVSTNNTNKLFTGLYFTANKGLFEVDDKVEVTLRNYTKEQESV